MSHLMMITTPANCLQPIMPQLEQANKIVQVATIYSTKTKICFPCFQIPACPGRILHASLYDWQMQQVHLDAATAA